MKVIIAGSRTYDNQLTVEDVALAVKKSGFKVTEVVSGESKHEDSLAHAYSEINQIVISEFLIDWNDISSCSSPKKNRFGKLYNPNASSERNEKMLRYADGLIIFLGDESKDTQFILSAAKKTDILIYISKPNPEYFF